MVSALNWLLYNLRDKYCRLSYYTLIDYSRMAMGFDPQGLMWLFLLREVWLLLTFRALSRLGDCGENSALILFLDGSNNTWIYVRYYTGCHASSKIFSLLTTFLNTYCVLWFHLRSLLIVTLSSLYWGRQSQLYYFQLQFGSKGN